MRIAKQGVYPHSPTVTVLIRVYNGDPYLGEAIESILAQTFTDFELLVIDDGSTDRTPFILNAFLVRDSRVRAIRQHHRGANESARRGLEEARGTYVAIMDADDRSHPGRLERQVSFLTDHPAYVLVGSAMRIIDEGGKPIGLRFYPLEDDELRKATMLYNPFGHSTVCFRRNVALACGGYTAEFEGAEDFDFNIRLRMCGKAANMAEPLIDYRIHESSFKTERLRTQLVDTIRLRAVTHKRYGYPFSPKARVVDTVQRLLLLTPPSLVNRLFKMVFFRSR